MSGPGLLRSPCLICDSWRIPALRCPAQRSFPEPARKPIRSKHVYHCSRHQGYGKEHGDVNTWPGHEVALMLPKRRQEQRSDNNNHAMGWTRRTKSHWQEGKGCLLPHTTSSSSRSLHISRHLRHSGDTELATRPELPFKGLSGKLFGKTEPQNDQSHSDVTSRSLSSSNPHANESSTQGSELKSLLPSPSSGLKDASAQSSSVRARGIATKSAGSATNDVQGQKAGAVAPVKVRRILSQSAAPKTPANAMRPTPRRSKANSRRIHLFRTAKPHQVESVEASSLHIDALDPSDQPPVPGLQYRLDRVLFNPGVHQLQDLRTRVYNFDPYLEHIMPVEEFDFNSLRQYKTSSEDLTLSALAKAHGKRYVGSTSSMTGILAHFHYLLSNWRDLDISMLSQDFPETSKTFTKLNRAPNAIFLRYKPESGTYAIDADKEFDTPNVLMMLGKSMELLLTKPRREFERHKKGVDHPITEAERSAPESYQYTTMGDFLMRSQLDARDPRLPGTGTFDLKTRAVMGIRMNAQEYEVMSGYEIQGMQGKYESYEREFYDMLRSTLLKYSLQVRMGRMDGIFLAFHNIRRIFGFQYIPVHEMDKALHGQSDRCLGDQEFKLSLNLLNKILNQATAKFPEKSLRMFFCTQKELIHDPVNMVICAEPVEEAQIEEIQTKSKALVDEYERRIMGEDDQPDAQDQCEIPSAAPPGDEHLGAVDKAASAAEDGRLDAETPKKQQPQIYVAKLIVQNQKYRKEARWDSVGKNRPEGMKPHDRWRTNYILNEIQDLSKKWRMYDNIKRQRKSVYDKMRKDNAAGTTKDKQGSYMKKMNDLARRGRSHRKRLDALDAGKDKLVLGSEDTEPSEEINSLDDYLKWMYER